MTEIKYTEGFDALMNSLEQNGALLVSGDVGNPMTIGWATVGRVWSRPMLTAYVRPSRYSFDLLEVEKGFAVCVIPEEMKKELALCGSKSGRNMDKITACGFHLQKGERIETPYIRESILHYECRIVHKNDVIDAQIDPEIRSSYYLQGDFHRVYYGEIVGTFKHK